MGPDLESKRGVMRTPLLRRFVVCAAAAAAASTTLLGGTAMAAQGAPSAAAEIVKLWSGPPPGTESWNNPETILPQPAPGPRTIHVIRNVSTPTLTVVRPAADKANGVGVIVLPGGGFMGLAWDVEGTEVAQWLAGQGITAFILKYRIQDGGPQMLKEMQEAAAATGSQFDGFMKVLGPRRQIAAADALQAVRIVRANAAGYGISPDRIGMMGFSAGAIATMEAVVAGDAASRPDFAVPVYGAMTNGGPSKDSPPLFIVAAEDDETVAVAKSREIYRAWSAAGRDAELHIYKTGGHGFGVGRPGTESTAWPAAFEAWLKSRGIVGPAD